jgi:hypothetical protein
MKLLIVGGQNSAFAHSKEEWARHRCGIVVTLDTETGVLSKVIQYDGSAKYLPKDGSVTFKAASLVGDRLILCTTVEILEFRLSTWDFVRSVSHPWFNDVHHAVETSSGTLIVANTGLDMVMELTWEGECLRHWFVAPNSGWDKFDRDVDYRRIASTKPHESHPNFITFDGHDGFFVTRFQQRDAVNPVNGSSFEIDVGFPHDGVPDGESVWYTSVNGYVSRLDMAAKKLMWRADLNRFATKNMALGWCRGIAVLDNWLAVGFSRLRPTKFRENVQWISNKLSLANTAGVMPTRVMLLSRTDESLRHEFNVESAGMNAIFSIHVLE